MSNVEKLQKLYLGVLDEDYKTEIDNDGDVVFKHPDMGTLFLSLTEDDPEFFCLVYPNFLDSKQVKDDFNVDEFGFFRAVNEANRRCKAANVVLHWSERDKAWNASVRIESFIAAPDQLPEAALVKSTLDRNMSAIRSVIQSLVEQLRGDDENSDKDADSSATRH